MELVSSMISFWLRDLNNDEDGKVGGELLGLFRAEQLGLGDKYGFFTFADGERGGDDVEAELPWVGMTLQRLSVGRGGLSGMCTGFFTSGETSAVGGSIGWNDGRRATVEAAADGTLEEEEE